jgi:glyoxylase-like metal-dependent hydrolase (beta-lactamase superfamily II)
MYFEQFYLGCLSQASYMLGSEGVAAVVDPRRDVGVYLEEAAKRGLQIRYVIETHLHADFVSGHCELAALTGATICFGARAEASFPHLVLRDGEELTFGRCRLKCIETPGHSLDSISILVTDLDRSPEPLAVLTGDTLFIGDVGRPDLSMGKSAEEMASLLFQSLHRKLLRLPDGVEVYPAHGAGSLCGKQMGLERSSTIGRERATNYALRPTSEAEFVRLITTDLPERPGYFALDKELNRAGAGTLGELAEPPALSPAQVLAAQQAGAVVLDTRTSAEFAWAHVPGSVQIGLSGQFAAWAGDLLGLRSSLILVTEQLAEARLRLARVGIEAVIGYLEGGIDAWGQAGLPIEAMTLVSAEELRGRLGSVQLIDTRRPDEWEAGHIEGAKLIPLHELAARAGEVDKAVPVAVYCAGGYRSTIAASLLEKAGCTQVLDLAGGYGAWLATAAGMPN